MTEQTIIVLEILGGSLTLITGIAVYHKWYAKKAVHESQVTDVIKWFKPNPEDPDHETLPEMVRSLVRGQAQFHDDVGEIKEEMKILSSAQAGFDTRLAKHLISEEKEVTDVKNEIVEIKKEIRTIKEKIL